jgi:hypothetical protein
MERRLARGLALVLVVAAAALVVLRPTRPGAAAPKPEPAVRHVDAPLGRVACDEVPVKVPDPEELAADERDRPYHLLVRVLEFKTLTPVDVDPARLVVLGAGGVRRVGTGEYYFESLPISYTSVALFDPETPEPAGPPGPRQRPQKAAERNPVHMARGAITTCDLVAIGPHDLEETLDLHGIVQEKATLEPIESATVCCGTQRAVTDRSGRFAFERPVTWFDVIHATGALCDGYAPFGVRGVSLPVAWIRRVREEKEARFLLARAPALAGAPLIPNLAR